MRKTVVGMVNSYGDAERIVEQLELAGIVGNEVEVVKNAEDEVTGFSGQPAKSSHERFAERIRRLLHPLRHSDKDHGPDRSSEDPEPYVSQVRNGRTLIFVRVPDVDEADRAAELLRANGAYDPCGGAGPRVFWEDAQPESTPPRNVGEKQTTMGDSGVTAGGARDDLEGRGTRIRKQTHS
jgi:hypothetical protein